MPMYNKGSPREEHARETGGMFDELPTKSEVMYKSAFVQTYPFSLQKSIKDKTGIW